MQESTLQNQERLLAFLATGIYSSPDIQQRFGFSQPVISRLLTQLADRVLVIGKARARRYSKLRDLRGLGWSFPVYAINAEGNACLLGTLSCVAHSDFLWQPVTGREQLFKSLPWFLADLHPEGFVGRAFVRTCHQEVGLPPRSNDWREDHTLLALARRGEDCMGNLVVGQESLERYFRLVQTAGAASIAADRIELYPRLAREAMEGQPAGSSAGGEQPKFTTSFEQDGTVHNVLVKFSPPLTTDEGRRWADLLLCEHHTQQVLQQAGIATATSCVLEAGGRLFLEVSRFDRTGRYGRLPIISLRAVDNEFYGYQDNWVNAANRMEKDGRLSAQDASALRRLSLFGSLIANNDQHFGNVSLVMAADDKRFTLAPVYDQLPMLYRPMDGVTATPSFTPSSATAAACHEWPAAFDSACLFWDQVQADPRISEPFRRICAENLATLERLKSSPRLIL